MLNFVTEYYSKRKLFHIFLPIERAIFECAGKHLETVFAFVTQRLHPIFSFVFSLSGSSSSERYKRKIFQDSFDSCFSRVRSKNFNIIVIV